MNKKLVVAGALALAALGAQAQTAGTWFGGIGGAIDVHRLSETLLLPLVGLHLCGALYQRLVLDSDALKRMTRPGLAQER